MWRYGARPERDEAIVTVSARACDDPFSVIVCGMRVERKEISRRERRGLRNRSPEEVAKGATDRTVSVARTFDVRV
jgi:hypothetical protein